VNGPKEGKKKREEIEDKIERELYGDALSNKGAGFSDIEDAQSVKPSVVKRKPKKKDQTSDEDNESDLFSDNGRK
jgi:hypothetical protein